MSKKPRKPLRRTPFKRKPGAKGLVRRKWMNRVSKKRKALMAKVKPFRDEYLASKLLCEVCIKRPPIEVHEITRGPAREESLDKPEVVLAVCRKCHDQLGDARVWPVSRQIALKFLRSPLLVNPQIVNKLRGRADTALTWDDVVVHLDLT
jgi:hypothetical protein